MLQIQRGGIRAQNDDFRPTPIPLNEWHHERTGGRAGTLHETFKTESPPSIAAIPAHYWEDALRHSVYLTLVRDKIDQLIAKGDVISPYSKHDSYDSKEIDDHDLWDKIKSAPFDRLPEEEPSSFGDVTIMAKGRLLEDSSGFRFAEDERTKEKCSRDKCMDGVKAFWSVKRVRQRDQETSPGKYHYELTFSVISQIPKKQRTPYENPIRTFTVKETSPNGIVERPQEREKFDPVSTHTARPERSIWFHRNIAPSKSFTGRKQYFSGLDRIFSSFFSDDDDRSFESTQTKYKPNSYSGQMGSQYSKIGHVGIAMDPHPVPYPYRPHTYHHVRPPLPAPPTNPIQHQYIDNNQYTTANSNPYAHYSYDHRVESSQSIKTTRPAVLPTPLPPFPSRDQSSEVTNTMSLESTAYTPDNIKTHKNYNKPKPSPTKVNYFTDHVRPPVYNAPPGVFVTMDKKPFKPMPPLKLVHPSKPHRANKPIDFRPSPQILDHSSEQGSFSDTAFRPIMMNYGDSNSSENNESGYVTKKNENKNRKTTSGKKPQKKHENIKSHRVTTAVPDIITVQSSSEDNIETMDWTNILGAFTKTTPMFTQTEKMQIPETTTPMATTVAATSTKKIPTTTEETKESTMVTLTTVKPKKRTRPPPKFAKQDKIKKHKRITTTTTTNAPENVNKKIPLHDLTPQASSAATGTMKPVKEIMNKTITSKTSTTSTTSTTTKKPTTKSTTTTTTTQTPTTTMKNSGSSTTQSKSRNRFRQSTLFYKGTSVKHDRWSSKNQTVTTPISTSSLHRRKGSNFQGYVSSTTPRQMEEERMKEKNHADRKLNLSNLETSTNAPDPSSQPSSNNEETVDQYESNSVLPIESSQETGESNKNNNDESKDHLEYIFQSSTAATNTKHEEESSEIEPSSNTTPKNKNKCKKKKNHPSTTVDPSEPDFESLTIMPAPKTSSETATTNDILQELFNYNEKINRDENSKDLTDLDEEESSNHESFLKADSDFDFLEMFSGKKEHRQSKSEENDYDYEGDDDDEDDNENNNYNETEDSKIRSFDDDTEIESDEDENEDEHETLRNSYTDKKQKKRPLSFLELMAMS